MNSKLLSICYDEGSLTKVLVVYENIDGNSGTKIVNSFYDQEAEDLYRKLVTKID